MVFRPFGGSCFIMFLFFLYIVFFKLEETRNLLVEF